MDQEKWDKKKIITIYGQLFQGRLFSQGKRIYCSSYGSINKEYPRVLGFFNLKYVEAARSWIIFQVVEHQLDKM